MPSMKGLLAWRVRKPLFATTSRNGCLASRGLNPKQRRLHNSSTSTPQFRHATAVFHRSSAALLPHTPPKKSSGSVIPNWQRGDILIGRLHVCSSPKEKTQILTDRNVATEARCRLVPVANRRDPRVTRSAPTSDEAARAGGACSPTGASRRMGAQRKRCHPTLNI